MRACTASLMWLAVLIAATPYAGAEQECVFLNALGRVERVKNASAVPKALRSRVVCNDTEVAKIAAPETIDVGRDARTASFSTDLGPMKVRWARATEDCFGRSPARAVGVAARAVTRAIRTGRFTADVRYVRREWQVVFLEKSAAFGQIPLDLTLNQHPGFMLPPNKIYLVTDFIAPNCDKGGATDKVLERILLHEFGHAIEFITLGDRQGESDRERAEGFATWFEYYAAGQPEGLVSEYRATVRLRPSATQHVSSEATAFRGTREDYLRAALRMQAVVEKRGVSGLMQVYAVLREKRVVFDSAVEEAIGWNATTLAHQVDGMVSR